MSSMLDIKVEIKSCIVRTGTSLTKVMKALNKKKSITTGYSNIANKIIQVRLLLMKLNISLIIWVTK